jgi:DNA (cytosine-5)-methyltransferase 1
MNKPATETHLAAFPGSRHITHHTEEKTESANIKDIPDETWRAYKSEGGGIYAVFAGFPCQGFSHAGKKRKEDPRNELVYEFARVVDAVRPEWLIGENVTGLLRSKGRDPLTGKERPVIDIIGGIFERIGYHITYRVFLATDHGVPQERKRLILIGSPKEKGWPVLPSATALTVPSGHRMPSLRSLLETHLHGAVPFPKENLPTGLSPHFWIRTEETEATGTPHPNLVRLVRGIRGLTRKEKEQEEEQKEKEKEEAVKKAPTMIVPGGLISFGVRKSAYHGQILDPDAPSKTIICTYHSCPRLFVGLHHPASDTYWVRCLSVTELGQIQGFPKEYPWKGKEKEQITQIGNAVPPPLAEAILRMLPLITYTKEKEEQAMKGAGEDATDEDENEEEDKDKDKDKE